MRISFIGLGQMGKGMANNLAKSDCDLLVSDVNENVLAEFNEKNIRTTKEILDVTDSDIVFLCLPNEKIVENVILSENGIAGRMDKGKIIVDCSTINYMSSLSIGEKLKDLGIEFIDAPISGMQSKAEEGTLTIMCGGDEEVFNIVKPYLDFMGNNVLYMGKSGNGQLTKMINNSLYDIKLLDRHGFLILIILSV